MRPVVKTLGSVAAATASVAALQTTAGAGYLTLTASPSFTYAQQLSLTSAADLHTVNATFAGYDADGHVQTETIACPTANTVTTTKFFSSVTSVYVDGAIGTNMSAGNTALSVSSAFIFDYLNPVASWGMAFVPSGSSATYRLAYTYDDPFDLTAVKTWIADTSITGKTATSNINGTGNYRAARIEITAWTAGTVTGTLIQGIESRA